MTSANRPAGPGQWDPRFYGRRSGHKLNPGRRRLMDTLLPTLRMPQPEPGGVIDPAVVFGRTAPVWLEIGFGGGEHLAAQARANPQVNIIGCEPFANGVASLLGHLAGTDLTNVRIHDDDARPLLAALPEGCVERMFILFPDPWPKKRHHKRRFVGPDSLDQMARVLADGAELRFGSDHDGYVDWALMHLTDDERFEWLAEGPDDWRVRPDDWPATRYETKALARGESCAYLRFIRCPRNR